jgi:dihydrofolate reductase
MPNFANILHRPEAFEGLQIGIIAAVNQNNVIGDSKATTRYASIPWHLPEDLKRFKRITTETGGIVLMGRTTFETIGKPLPGRLNIVVSRSILENKVDANHVLAQHAGAGITVASSLEAALRVAADHINYTPGRNSLDRRVWVIGGATLYRQCLPFADLIELSRVITPTADGDVLFPDFIGRDGWKMRTQEFKATPLVEGVDSVIYQQWVR